MFMICVTIEGNNTCITLGEKEKVEKAVQQECELYPDMTVIDYPHNTAADMYNNLDSVREDYPSAEVIEV